MAKSEKWQQRNINGESYIESAQWRRNGSISNKQWRQPSAWRHHNKHQRRSWRNVKAGGELSAAIWQQWRVKAGISNVSQRNRNIGNQAIMAKEIENEEENNQHQAGVALAKANVKASIEENNRK